MPTAPQSYIPLIFSYLRFALNFVILFMNLHFFRLMHDSPMYEHLTKLENLWQLYLSGIRLHRTRTLERIDRQQLAMMKPKPST